MKNPVQRAQQRRSEPFHCCFHEPGEDKFSMQPLALKTPQTTMLKSLPVVNNAFHETKAVCCIPDSFSSLKQKRKGPEKQTLHAGPYVRSRLSLFPQLSSSYIQCIKSGTQTYLQSLIKCICPEEGEGGKEEKGEGHKTLRKQSSQKRMYLLLPPRAAAAVVDIIRIRGEEEVPFPPSAFLSPITQSRFLRWENGG